MSQASHGSIGATLPARTARQLERARRFFWQHDRFAIYRFDHAVPPLRSESIDTIQLVGVNGLARAGDRALPSALSANGEGMRRRGDSGLVGWSANGQIAAWVWVRSGGYTERAGCGFLKIPHDIRVAYELKVRPDLRGRGIASFILGELGRRLESERPSTQWRATIAFVAPWNTASRRSLERAGFARAGGAETRRIAGVRLVGSLPTLGDGELRA